MRAILTTSFKGCEDAPFLVERMSPAGLDLFVAASTDPECGQMLLIGLGGFLLETVRDVVAVPLLSREGEVATLLRESAIGRYLASPAGARFGGIGAIGNFAERLGDLYVAAGNHLSLIELNPVRLVPEKGRPIILDALLATKGIT